jgi:ankyrin repeat protein
MHYQKLLFILSVAFLLACQPGAAGANELLDAVQNGDAAAVDRVLKDQPGLLSAADSTGQTALHAAISRKQVAVMESLLKHGADYRLKDAQGRTALALAAQSGSEELATRFLLNIPDVDLPEAVAQGDADYVRLVLLGDPAQIFPDRAIYREYETTYTILATAFDHRRFEILKLLLAKAPKLEGRDAPKNMVAMRLCEAVWQGQTDVLADHIAAGNDVNVAEEYSSVTPLHSAAAAGNLKAVQMLLRAGAKVNLGSEGWTALHDAAGNGRRDVVEALLAAGAKLDAGQTGDETAVDPARIVPPPSTGWRPIHKALWENHLDVAGLLEQRGAKIDAWLAAGLGRTEEAKRLIAQLPADRLAERPAVEGPPPVFWAARCGRLDTLKALWTDDSLTRVTLQHRSLGLGGYTLLHVAAEAGQTDVMRWLIQHGAPLGAESADGHYCQRLTPLHVAAAAGQIEAVKVLLAAGANIEDPTERSSGTRWLAHSAYTPLLVAAIEGKKEMVEFLLDRGADIEGAATTGPDYPQGRAPDLDRGADSEAAVPDRVTALSAAATGGHKEICELLLARGAKLGGKPGANALLAAIGWSHPEIVELLLQRGADVNAGAADGRSPVLAALLDRAEGSDCGQKILKLLLDRRPGLKGIMPQQETSLLLAAVKAKNLALVRSALDLGMSAGEKDFDKLLIEAGTCGNVEIMKLLLAAGSKLPAGSQGQIQPDTMEAPGGSRGSNSLGGVVPERLLSAPDTLKTPGSVSSGGGAGPSPGEIRSHTMKAAFITAIQFGHKDMVRFLIGQGCDANGRGNVQFSSFDAEDYGHDPSDPAELPPLVAAVRSGHKLVMIVLLEAGAKPAVSDSSRAGRALDTAAAAGRADLIRILLAHGAVLNVDNSAHEWPAVATAARRGDIAALDLLLDADKTPGAAAEALHAAVLGRHAEMVRCLAARGVDLNIRDQQGRTPLHTALYPSSRYVNVYEWSPLNETAAVLLELGADPNLRDNDGLTPLQLAVVHGRTAFAEKLIAKGARLDAFSAAGLGRIEPVAAALAADPALLGKTQLHGPPLVWAAAAGQAQMVKWLLDHGAEVNAARDAKFDVLSPLSAAVRGGNRAVVESLLDRGADPNRALAGDSPLRVAAGLGYAEIAGLLIDRGANLEPPNRVGSGPYSADSSLPVPAPPPPNLSPAPSATPGTVPVPPSAPPDGVNSDEFRPFGGFFADLFDDGSTQQKPRQMQPPAPVYKSSPLPSPPPSAAAAGGVQTTLPAAPPQIGPPASSATPGTAPAPPPAPFDRPPAGGPRTLTPGTTFSVPTVGGFAAEGGSFTPFDAAVEGTREAPDVCDRDPRELPPCRRDLVMLRLLDAYRTQNKKLPQASLDKALHWAAGQAAFETVKRLLDAGANPNGPANARPNESPPLVEAVWAFRSDSVSGAARADRRQQCAAVIRLLVARGADPNLQGYSGSALSIARENSGDVELFEFLSKAAGAAEGP